MAWGSFAIGNYGDMFSNIVTFIEATGILPQKKQATIGDVYREVLDMQQRLGTIQETLHRTEQAAEAAAISNFNQNLGQIKDYITDFESAVSKAETAAQAKGYVITQNSTDEERQQYFKAVYDIIKEREASTDVKWHSGFNALDIKAASLIGCLRTLRNSLNQPKIMNPLHYYDALVNSCFNWESQGAAMRKVKRAEIESSAAMAASLLTVYYGMYASADNYDAYCEELKVCDEIHKLVEKYPIGTTDEDVIKNMSEIVAARSTDQNVSFIGDYSPTLGVVVKGLHIRSNPGLYNGTKFTDALRRQEKTGAAAVVVPSEAQVDDYLSRLDGRTL